MLISLPDAGPPAAFSPFSTANRLKNKRFAGCVPIYFPSSTALYCTISAILKSKVACISAFYPNTNTVGYMSKDMATAGYYNYTPMFVGVDGSNPAVKDIVPSSTEATSLEGGVIKLYVLDTNRKFQKTFSWYTEDDFMDEDGWYFGSEEAPTDYTLGAGESLQVYSPYQITFTYAGQVDQAQYDFTAPAAGYYMVGNQHATNMPVKDIVPASTEASTLEGGVIKLYVLDTNRKFAKTFSWYTEDDFMDEDGWYFGSEETPTTYELEPGEVLQVYTPYQLKLTFPGQSL